MAVDLTKLSGPELASKLSDVAREESNASVVDEACDRLREDTRVWQRNLERERDGLRDRVRELERELAQCRETMRGMHEARGELQRECDDLRERLARRVAELEAAHGQCLAQDRLDEANNRIAELEKAGERIGSLAKSNLERIVENDALKSRIAELERDNAEGAAKLGARLEQVMNERDELRELLEAEMSKPLAVLSFDGQAQIDKLRSRNACLEVQVKEHRETVATSMADAHVVSTADLSAFEVAAAGAADAMHVDADGLGFVKRDWLERHRGLEQTARAQIQAAWGAGPGTTPLSETVKPVADDESDTVKREPGCQCQWEAGDSPCRVHGEDEEAAAERKAQEERRYGPDARTVEDVLRCNGWVETTTHHLASHLRETLATLDAVTGLAQRWETWHLGTLVGAEFEAASARCARELREALSGKR